MKKLAMFIALAFGIVAWHTIILIGYLPFVLFAIRYHEDVTTPIIISHIVGQLLYYYVYLEILNKISNG